MLWAILLSLVMWPVCAQDLYQTYGTSYGDVSIGVLEHSIDGGLVMAGVSYVSPEPEIMLTKTTATGVFMWTKLFGAGDDRIPCTCMEHSVDTGFVLGGIVDRQPHSRAFLMKTDATGVLAWSRDFAVAATHVKAFDVAERSDHGLVLTGSALNPGGGKGAQVVLLYTDASGELQWAKTYMRILSNCYAVAVQMNPSGGGVLAAKTHKQGSLYDADLMLLRVDATGALQWARSYDGGSHEHTVAMTPRSGGGYFVLGETDASEMRDWALLAIENTGAAAWAKKYGSAEDERPLAVLQRGDGHVMISGYRHRRYGGTTQASYDFILVSATESGSVVWSKSYANVGYYRRSVNSLRSSLAVASGTRIAAVGNENTIHEGDGNMVLIVEPFDGDSSSGTSVPMPSAVIPITTAVTSVMVDPSAVSQFNSTIIPKADRATSVQFIL